MNTDERPNEAQHRHPPAGFITSAAAAEILGRAPWTVRDMARRRVIPHYRPYGPRGPIAFKAEELEQFLASTRVSPAA